MIDIASTTAAGRPQSPQSRSALRYTIARLAIDLLSGPAGTSAAPAWHTA